MKARNAIKIRPLGNRVLVRRKDESKMSAGGIVIPDTAKEKPMRGEVLATGSGKVLTDGGIRAMDVNVGDEVL